MNKPLVDCLLQCETHTDHVTAVQNLGITFFQQYFLAPYQGLRTVAVERLQRLPDVQKYIGLEEKFSQDMRRAFPAVCDMNHSDRDERARELSAHLRDLAREGTENANTLDHAMGLICQRMLLYPVPWENATIQFIGETIYTRLTNQKPQSPYDEFQAMLASVQQASRKR